MSVMMISEVSGQTLKGYDAMLATVGEALKEAPGFVMHVAHPVETGCRVVEVWNSQEDATRFYASIIAPNLQAGIRPKLNFQPLHSVVRP